MKATLALAFVAPALANVLVARGGHEECPKPETKTVTCTETVTKPAKTVTCTETEYKTVEKYKTAYETVTCTTTIEKPVEKYKTEYKTATVTCTETVTDKVTESYYATVTDVAYSSEKVVETYTAECPTVYITETGVAPPPPPPPSSTSSVAATTPTQVTVSGASRLMSWGPAAIAAAVAGFMVLM